MKGKVVFMIACLAMVGRCFGQSTEDYSVELNATTTTSPPTITLQWKSLLADSPTYFIYKKAKTDISWGSPIATLTGADSSFTDSTVITDSAYEYFVNAVCSTWTATGFIYAGISNPPTHHMGALILMIDSLFSDSCAASINQLMYDLSGDGWQLISHVVSRSMPDTDVKALIMTDYSTVPGVSAVILLGHISVPYSADYNLDYYPPDGHVPYHQGAWPADLYYSCLAGPWTDSVALDTLGSWTANWNIPGDGKWDQDSLLSPSILQVSRIDFYNMPSFGTSEVQMMNSYLARDHQYKMDSLGIVRRALISDNFGPFGGEAFAANGWRNFAPLVNRANVQALPYISSLADSSFQWSYGCGGGSFTSASGIGSTTDFAANPVNGIFTMLFGSFFGDWNDQDNFLRAPLCASTPALTNCWAGRPNWFFHHMALGGNIGYSAWLTQNNGNLLYTPGNYGAGWIYVALMGDLSLRTDYIKPISNLVVTPIYHSGAVLSWTASPDSLVDGYYVYRCDSDRFGDYQLISGLVTTTTFYDSTGSDGLKFYMVRPEKPEATPSGGYLNLGVGVVDSATVSYLPLALTDQKKYDWTTTLYPNPATSFVTLRLTTDAAGQFSFYLTDIRGQLMDPTTKNAHPGANTWYLDCRKLVPGNYLLHITGPGGSSTQQFVKM